MNHVETTEPQVQVDHPRCPYCHTDVIPGQGEKQSCGECMAWHHQACWDEHSGCSACNRGRPATSPSGRSVPLKRTGPSLLRRTASLLAVLVALGALGWQLNTAPPEQEPPTVVEVDTSWHSEFLAAETEAEKTRWCRVGAEAGDPAAMNLLGFRLAGGIGCATDFTEAAEWGRKGAELGHSNAMFGYARMLEGGYGVEQDLAAAAHWYRRALEAGDPQAQHHLERLLKAHPELAR